MTEQITAICQECQKQFAYVLKPGFPRKYCIECSAVKKAQFENKSLDESIPVPVERPGDTTSNKVVDTTSNKVIKAPTGEYQSLVYNKTLCANSYEVGKAGCRFKLYFEDIKELQEKMAELKLAGFLDEDIPKEAFE